MQGQCLLCTNSFGQQINQTDLYYLLDVAVKKDPAMFLMRLMSNYGLSLRIQSSKGRSPHLQRIQGLVEESHTNDQNVEHRVVRTKEPGMVFAGLGNEIRGRKNCEVMCELILEISCFYLPAFSYNPFPQASIIFIELYLKLNR